jgi:hypothetical protein
MSELSQAEKWVTSLIQSNMHKKLMIAHVDEEKTQKTVGILHGPFGIFVCVTSKISDDCRQGSFAARQIKIMIL